MTKKSYHHNDLAAELLRAAEVELLEKGVERFSLRAVAKRAGVSHGAPAHHFKDVTGLLSAIAAVGDERLVATQVERQALAAPDAKSQLIAVGLGYIVFAMGNPALFRLMFASEKPDRSDEAFATASMSAFNKLVMDIQKYFEIDPEAKSEIMKQVMTSWSLVHGLAELVISGRAEVPFGFSTLTPDEQEAVITGILHRAFYDL